MKQPSECQRLRETDKLRPVFTSDQIVQLIPAVKFRPSGRRDTAGVVRLPAAFLISLQFGSACVAPLTASRSCAWTASRFAWTASWASAVTLFIR